jgi:hypothetical protein
MKRATLLVLGMLGPLFVAGYGLTQEPGPAPACVQATGAGRPACNSSCPAHPSLHWTSACFPCKSCPDDYCPHAYPRQCWLPYPPFYQCVPAGNCCGVTNNDRLTWWFLPRPRALHEALWRQP